ncbi:MAG: peptidylprolyl isomerase [Smithellaceae bacterium]|nr:peptidylprolyl isomerase [Smithellaceae bacterium]
MGKRIHFAFLITLIGLLVFLSLTGCKGKDETVGSSGEVAIQEGQTGPQANMGQASPFVAPVTTDVAVEVDGVRMSKAQLDAEVQKKMATIKTKTPENRLQKLREAAQKQIINDFVVRTLLNNEVARQRIRVEKKEVDEAVDKLSQKLPENMKLEDLMRRANINKQQLREEIAFGLRINKLVTNTMGGKLRPSDKEVSDFYKKNIDKFKVAEAVHTRHILIAVSDKDNAKSKTEKKAKAENLRRQLLEGADFATLAKANSDCPSKENGGDLGVQPRGRMDKAFEDAAFSQKVGDIGPVVETKYGYHIIQVLEHNPARTMELDGKMKDEIAFFLGRQKQQEAFNGLLKSLRDKAKIQINVK